MVLTKGSTFLFLCDDEGASVEPKVSKPWLFRSLKSSEELNRTDKKGHRKNDTSDAMELDLL